MNSSPDPAAPLSPQGILNKLTPDNFDRLSQQLLDVGITEAKTLIGLIAQVRIQYEFTQACVRACTDCCTCLHICACLVQQDLELSVQLSCVAICGQIHPQDIANACVYLLSTLCVLGLLAPCTVYCGCCALIAAVSWQQQSMHTSAT